MKDSSSLHLKVQELCDCFATSDPLKEMSKIEKDPDTDEAALKWLALAILHGINSNANTISIEQDKDGSVHVSAKYRKSTLPSPGTSIGEKIIAAVRGITHLEKDKGTTPLAFGFRNNSMELQIRTKDKKGEKKVTIEFP
jgi:hypothetical protein